MESDEPEQPVGNGMKPAPIILFLVTLAGFGIGVWLCLPSLSATPIYEWPFVIDIPLYAMLGSMLVLWHFPRNDVWAFVVGSGLVLYGPWSASVLLLNISVYFAPDQFAMSSLLLIGAMAMLAEGLLVLPLKATKTALAIALVWFAINSYLDYWMGSNSIHPSIPGSSLETMETFAWVGGILVPLIVYFIDNRVHAHPLTRKIHQMFCWIC